MPIKDHDERRKYAREWVAKRRHAFFSGKKCEWCGSVARLELHHLDPSKKISHSIWSWTEKRRLEEIAKCIVLCKTCHGSHHKKIMRIPDGVHGNPRVYRNGCRCNECRSAHAARIRDYRARIQNTVIVQR